MSQRQLRVHPLQPSILGFQLLQPAQLRDIHAPVASFPVVDGRIAHTVLARERALSQEQLGFEAGLTRNYISLIELGQRSPTLGSLERLAGALGVSASALIVRAERKLR